LNSSSRDRRFRPTPIALVEPPDSVAEPNDNIKDDATRANVTVFFIFRQNRFGLFFAKRRYLERAIDNQES
jgi:hypothetical protein